MWCGNPNVLFIYNSRSNTPTKVYKIFRKSKLKRLHLVAEPVVNTGVEGVEYKCCPVPCSLVFLALLLSAIFTFFSKPPTSLAYQNRKTKSFLAPHASGARTAPFPHSLLPELSPEWLRPSLRD